MKTKEEKVSKHNNLTDKGKPTERWGRKAMGLQRQRPP